MDTTADVGYDESSSNRTALKKIHPVDTTSDGSYVSSSPKILPKEISIKKLFYENKKYRLWFIFQTLYATQVFSAGLFVPLYAAEWFGNCLQSNNITVITGCTPNYSEYAYYATMFYSIAGLITFLFSSFIGHLSDKYGRKLFFYVAIMTWMIPRTIMIFYINFYLYWSLSILEGINGGDFFIASKGYLADIIPNPDERIIAYGFGQSSMGIGAILGAILAVVIGMVWNDHAVFFALFVLYLCLLLYAYFFIENTSADTNNSQSFNRRNRTVNPFKYLAKICHYPLILYISMLSLFMAIVEAGVLSSLFAYIGNEFSLDNQGESTLIYATYAVTMSISVILTGFLLSYLKHRRRGSDLNVMTLSVIIKIISLLLLASINLFGRFMKNYFVLYLSAFLYGISFFFWPTLNGILTKHLNNDSQGTGFGIVDAWTGIASIIAPFSFGYLYITLHAMNKAFALFLFASLFCILSILIILFPLRKILDKQIGIIQLFDEDKQENDETKPLKFTTSSIHSDSDDYKYDDW